jgi:hypothetical protein
MDTFYEKKTRAVKSRATVPLMRAEILDSSKELHNTTFVNLYV